MRQGIELPSSLHRDNNADTSLQQRWRWTRNADKQRVRMCDHGRGADTAPGHDRHPQPERLLGEHHDQWHGWFLAQLLA